MFSKLLKSFSASTMGPQVDTLFISLLVLCSLIFLGVAGTTVFFLVKYRKGTQVDRKNPTVKNLRLEIWIVGSFTLVMLGLFVWSARAYFELHTPPDDALEIFVMSKQWMWKFQHADDGRVEVNELHVPLNKAVKLVLSSDDVIHSLYIPEFRIKQDALPDRYTSTWFQATKTGVYILRCTQYCGTDHARMLANIFVLRPEDYENWKRGVQITSGTKPAEQTGILLQRGKALYEEIGCQSCHAADSQKTAPALNGLFGSKVRLANHESVIADENYIRESILEPNAKIVEGYQPIMPTFKGLLKGDDLAALVVYIKSLSVKPPDKKQSEKLR